MSTVYVDIATRTAPPRDGLKWGNGKQKTRRPYPQAGGTRGLSNDQKAKLCALARRAFDVVHSRSPIDTREMEAWRREEQAKAVSKQSLTTCTQGDYLPLLGHFAHLAGEDGIAYNAHIEDSTADRRIALHKLDAECKARGLTLAYPAAICRNKFKCQLEEANPKQLWKLVFDVRTSKHKPIAKAKPAAVDIPF